MREASHDAASPPNDRPEIASKAQTASADKSLGPAQNAD